jgi:hypothetical protein
MWNTIFDRCSADYFGTRYAILAELEKKMAFELTKWSKDLVKTIFMLMDYDKLGIVSE